jgi:hypothetical protein
MSILISFVAHRKLDNHDTLFPILLGRRSVLTPQDQSLEIEAVPYE